MGLGNEQVMERTFGRVVMTVLFSKVIKMYSPEWLIGCPGLLARTIPFAPPDPRAFFVCCCSGVGLPRRDPFGDPFGGLIVKRNRLALRSRSRSVRSPASVSLPEPDPPAPRAFCAPLDSFTRVVLAFRDKGSAVIEPAGEPGREGGAEVFELFLFVEAAAAAAEGLGVEPPLLAVAGGERCCFLCFLRVDSAPDASDRPGDPGRLRAAEEALRDRSVLCFGRPEGVFVPLVEVPERKLSVLLVMASLVFLFSPALRSSSFFRSSSLARSVSEVSDSLCFGLVTCSKK